MSGEDEELHCEFDLAYEKRLVANLLSDGVFCRQWLQHFQATYFSAGPVRIFVGFLKDFFERFNRPPDKDESGVLVLDHIKQYGDRGYPPSMQAEQDYRLLVDLVDECFSFTTYQLEFIKVHSLAFLKQAALKEGILNAAKLIGTKQEPQIVDIIQKAMLVGANALDFGLDYFGTARIRAMKRYATPKETNQIPFFIPKLDSSIGGVGFRRDGSGVPELLMFGSAPNVGKSRAIGHCCKIGAMLGLNGIIFSAEQSDALFAERMDMSIARLDTAGLYDAANLDVLSKRIEMVARQGQRNRLWIKKYPARTATIGETVTLARTIMNVTGLPIHFCAWDYTTEFTAEGNYERLESKFSEIVSAQKRASDELECAGIGAFQVNREGARAAIPELLHAAETLAVARVADTVITMAQTEEEYKAEPPEMRWCVKKSRGAEREIQVLILDDRKRMFFMQHSDDGKERETQENN